MNKGALKLREGGQGRMMIYEIISREGKMSWSANKAPKIQSARDTMNYIGAMLKRIRLLYIMIIKAAGAH